MADNENKKKTQPIRRNRIPQAPEAPVPELSALYRLESPSKSFVGDAVTALSRARTRGIRTTESTLNIGNVAIHTTASSYAGADKLLRYAVSAFTKTNAQNEKNPKLRIYADPRDFARACKVQIDPPPLATPTDQTKIKKNYMNFLAKISKNADTLMRNAIFTWEERVQGKLTSYNGISFIGGYRISSDAIMIEFTQSAAEYLVKLPITEVPRAYFAISEEKPNAIAIAQLLMQRNGMERNITKDTERIIKIDNILSKATSFPSLEEAKANKWGWERVIKEPFEEALDELYQKGFLTEWHYCLPNKTELTKDQAENITSYENFASLYLFYELTEFPAHDIRAQAIAKKREAQKARRTKNKKQDQNEHTKKK